MSVIPIYLVIILMFILFSLSSELSDISDTSIYVDMLVFRVFHLFVSMRLIHTKTYYYTNPIMLALCNLVFIA